MLISSPVLETPTTLLGSLIVSSITAMIRNSYQASWKAKTQDSLLHRHDCTKSIHQTDEITFCCESGCGSMRRWRSDSIHKSSPTIHRSNHHSYFLLKYICKVALCMSFSWMHICIKSPGEQRDQCSELV